MRLILASASQRRAQILREAGIPFEVRAAAVDETPWHDERPEHLVRRLARAKADAIEPPPRETVLVLGADTEVVVDGRILGKPAGPHEAREMLRTLSGRTHEVLTGLCLLRHPDRAARTEVEITRVTFAPLEPREIENYIATGEPFDKAGAYAIQGRAGRFVTRVEGCYFNVVGLPLARLYRLLRELGWPPD